MDIRSLSREVCEILGETFHPNAKPRNTKFVTAVLKAIEKGLRRGEDVRIDGFGTFYVRTRKTPRVYVPLTRYRDKDGKPIKMLVESRLEKVVSFYPHKFLRDAMKDPEPCESKPQK